jgi:hypothetical protein
MLITDCYPIDHLLVCLPSNFHLKLAFPPYEVFGGEESRVRESDEGMILGIRNLYPR